MKKTTDQKDKNSKKWCQDNRRKWIWAGSSGRKKKIEGGNNRNKVDIVRTQRKIDFMKNTVKDIQLRSENNEMKCENVDYLERKWCI